MTSTSTLAAPPVEAARSTRLCFLYDLLQRLLVKASAEGVPDEVLLEVFGYLQDDYNRFHRENALHGIIDPSPESRPCNPAGLQLVCRRWTELARPLFYRDQVAVDCGNSNAFATLCGVIGSDLALPLPRLIVLFLPGNLLRFGPLQAIGRQSRSGYRNGTRNTLRVLASTPRWDSLAAELYSFSSCVIAPRDDGGSSGYWALDTVARAVEIALIPDPQGRPRTLRELTLRFFPASDSDIEIAVGDLCRRLEELKLLPHLRLDFPFPLPAALLDPDMPRLVNILKHTSHAPGRAFLLSRDNTIKRISFGCHTEADAIALRARVESLGELNIVVQVDVLEV